MKAPRQPGRPLPGRYFSEAAVGDQHILVKLRQDAPGVLYPLHRSAGQVSPTGNPQRGER